MSKSHEHLDGLRFRMIGAFERQHHRAPSDAEMEVIRSAALHEAGVGPPEKKKGATPQTTKL